VRTTTQSFWHGLAVSTCVGLIPGVLIYFALEWISEPLAIIAAVAAWALTAYVILLHGYSHIRVPFGHVGVGVRGGDEPTGKIYKPGDHWGIPGVSAAIPVDTRLQQIGLTANFQATAADRTNVGVDAFLIGQVVDATKWLRVDDPRNFLREVLESSIRLFTLVVKDAGSVTQFRDLLADYLELEPRSTSALTPEHIRVRDALYALAHTSVAGGTASIDYLMQKQHVGELRRLANQCGFGIKEVKVEEYDIPAEIKAANVKLAVARTNMQTEKVRNNALAAMTKKMVEAKVNPDGAANVAAMVLGLPVTKTIHEFAITDAEKIAAALGNSIAQMIATLFTGGSGKAGGTK